MKKFLIYIGILCSFVQLSAFAQEQLIILPEESGESLVLLSDREIYGAGEGLHYYAIYGTPGGLNGGPLSTVLYVELINWDGTKQAASKVLIANGRAGGTIGIPKNIPSGVYYLRAYTKWMRNYPSSTYTYLPLRILNPYSREMLAGPAEGNGPPLAMEHLAEHQTEGIVLSGLKEHYGTGEQVEVEIQIPADLRSGRYSLGIAKTPAQSSLSYLMGRTGEEETEAGKIEFLPEINGLTLSGRITDSGTGEPVANGRLHLSSYSNSFLYAEVFSGKDGSFLFALPHLTGYPELHIANGSDSLLNHKVLLASEFCNKAVRLPYVPLIIDSTEQVMVREVLVNTQLKERYGSEADPDDETDEQPLPFYGKGTSVTYVSDYIELSDLREFIYEIIPQVSVSSSSEGSSLSIQGPSCMEIYPPLVLMDNVPVANNEEFLNIPSSRIERIEVLNRAYMVGNIRYSGIFSVYSGKKDMAGITQEGERHFFNFRLLEETVPLHKYETGPTETSLPDTRNLLFWNPEMELTETGSYSIHFKTPDIPGNYVLTLRGSGPEKSPPVFRKSLISVK